MPSRKYSHVVGFDDAPFDRGTRGNVPVIGVVFAGLRLEGVLRGDVRRDGANATRTLIDLIQRSKFYPQLQLVLLQGIALAGFNVVDLDALCDATERAIIVVSRRRPRLEKIRSALMTNVRGGRHKWTLIENAGPMERTGDIYMQRRGIGFGDAARAIRALAIHGNIPEPLRVAHLISGGIATGQSRGRP
jgi:endonuclease V-like protein UPF0215 family